MDKRRQARLNAEIKKVIGVALRDMKDPNVSALTSVTDVNVTSDLSYCDIKFSILSDGAEKHKTFETLKKAEGYFRKAIASNLSIRQVPELRIKLDESMEYADHINNILKKLDIKHNDNNPLEESSFSKDLDDFGRDYHDD